MDDWSIGYLWHSTFLLERLVLTVLAFMLARMVLIVIRVSYLLVRQAGSPDTTSSTRSELAVELSRKLCSLKSIFSTAPYLGLAGTCLGIMDGLSVGYTGTRHGFPVFVALGLSAALLSSAAGILVAVPATCLHNYVSTRLDLLKRDLSKGSLEKRRFPLKPHVSVFSYAVIAAPALALSVAAYMTFPSFLPPKGLPVRLKAVGALEKKGPSVESIVITLVSTKTSALPVIYVDSKKTSWDELENKLRSALSVRPPHSVAYVQADEDVDWRYLTDIIDLAEGLDVDVFLLTATPNTPATPPPVGVKPRIH